RGAQKLEAAGAAGAHHLIDSDTADLRAALLDLGRADIVYDAVGGAQFDAAFRAMRPEGRILSIGFASGTVPQVPANHLLVKNLSVMGVNWGAYLSFAPEALIDSLKACFAWYGAGRLRPHISARFPLSEAQAALDHLAARKSTGKVIVTMD
ncbi:MAG: zinc-binding dehydrogenase, partial [Pseudomonadota bacterium]